MINKGKGNINIELVSGKYGDNVYKATVEIIFSEDVVNRSQAHSFIQRALENRWQVADWGIIDISQYDFIRKD